jgi:hypothetical protein
VNLNDYLSTIYFVNAKTIGLGQSYTVNYVQENGLRQYFGEAVYDAATDRVVVTAQAPTCMTKVASLSFIKLA